jgi:hypothetical protein
MNKNPSPWEEFEEGDLMSWTWVTEVLNKNLSDIRGKKQKNFEEEERRRRIWIIGYVMGEF